MPTWIDFKELRSKLNFEEVLVHHGVEIKRRGDQHLGFCPLPGHKGVKNSQSFSANIERGIFHCFGCQAKGNVLDFAVLMHGESPTDGRAVKAVAAELRAKFCPEAPTRVGAKVNAKKAEPPTEQLELEAVVNSPLDFELQGLDAAHPYLGERGFVKETIAHFGLGYCARGSLSGRIAIPLYDAESKLIGYAGRVVDDSLISDDNPRYRLPGKRERNGKSLEFQKSLFLYNGYRFKAPSENVVVVEGFPSVWWLHQNGYPRVVATMGAEWSEEQAALIVSLVSPSGHVWVMPDGDKAGDKFAQTLIPRISKERFVRWLPLERDCQPTDLPVHQLKIFLTM